MQFPCMKPLKTGEAGASSSRTRCPSTNLPIFCGRPRGLNVKGHIIPCVPCPRPAHGTAFETYLCILRCDGLDTGLYRYLPLDHALCSLPEQKAAEKNRMAEGLLGQTFGAAAVFIWTTIPYRMEWRYSAFRTRSSPLMRVISAKTFIWL